MRDAEFVRKYDEATVIVTKSLSDNRDFWSSICKLRGLCNAMGVAEKSKYIKYLPKPECLAQVLRGTPLKTFQV